STTSIPATSHITLQHSSTSTVMKFSATTAACTVTAAVLCSSATAAPYGQTFTGEGTYYGDIPIGSGNCAMRGDLSVYDGMIPLAINAAQYEGSMMCGACIEGRGTGRGAGGNPITGSFKGFVMDQCPECAHGDLDWGTSGDGRWEIEWQFVPCERGGKPDFTFEGSNPWYWKIQATGCRGPVDELFVNRKYARKTDDNFFLMEEGTPFYGEAKINVYIFG
ncbi:unnamed protein product, partial [Sphacelaria rigidula]